MKKICLSIVFAIFAIFFIWYTVNVRYNPKHYKTTNQLETVEQTPVKENAPKEEMIKETPKVEETQPTEIKPAVNPIPYRLTSFYLGDGYGVTNCTGSGKCTNNFQINDKGWYTYQGMLVLAGATNELLNSNEFSPTSRLRTRVDGRHYFNYYDKVTISIDGIIYTGIILDSCGASMYVKENRLDLFVSSKEYAIDRGYLGNNPIYITY